MKKVTEKLASRLRRHRRIRSRVSGTKDCPRLAFFRSNTNVYAQLIDDTAGVTLFGSSSLKSAAKGSVNKAVELGAEVAKKAGEKGIRRVVFDRGGFMYTGSVKAFADAARAGGLEF